VRKAAEHLRLYRDRDVLVTGFADRRETGAERLAAERGRNLADLLAREEGVAAGRIHVAASPPGKPLQGERLEKAVIRFLDEKER
jgi:outer membrane protein OmpA-like peptidoglycan-associated protein